MLVTANLEPCRSGVNPARVEPSPTPPDVGDDVSVPRFTDYQPSIAREAEASRSASAMPRRPRKGQLLVGFVLLSVCIVAVNTVWNSFFRYSAYGIVEGHVVEAMPPWNGEVQHVHVREGDRVAPGQLLVTLDDPELRQKLARLEEELPLARATLTAEAARLEWQGQADADRRQQAVADYYESWGQLLNEQAQLELAKRRLERAEELVSSKVISGDEFDSTYHAEAGQRQKVAKMETAVEEMRRRAEADPQAARQTRSQLEPHLLRIQALQSEIARCQEALEKGRIKSAVSGMVIKRECLAGDYAHQRDPVLSLVEEGTVEIALYVPQTAARKFALGDVLKVKVRPRADYISCKVVRIGQRFQPAPKSIERYYLSNEQLLPVYLRPETTSPEHVDLCLGGVAVVPRSWWPFAIPVQESAE